MSNEPLCISFTLLVQYEYVRYFRYLSPSGTYPTKRNSQDQPEGVVAKLSKCGQFNLNFFKCSDERAVQAIQIWAEDE